MAALAEGGAQAPPAPPLNTPLELRRSRNKQILKNQQHSMDT